MKSLMIFLMMSVFALTANCDEIKISKSMCSDLALESSIAAFSPDKNGLMYVKFSLNNRKGTKYINSVRRSLASDLEAVCDSADEKVKLSDLKRTYHGSCVGHCDEEVKTYRIKSRRLEANGVCLSICLNTYNSLNRYFEWGFREAKKN